jgi:uncharacterized membrane protein YphA (DoxX/SURF4 family)
MVQQRAYVHLIAAVLVSLFIYTGLYKLIDFSEFSSQMHNQPLPRWLTSLATWTIPCIELFIAALLLFDKSRKCGFMLAFLLVTVYTVYVTLILSDAFEYIPCSCTGIAKQLNWTTHLIINILAAALAYIGYRTQREK